MNWSTWLLVVANSAQSVVISMLIIKVMRLRRELDTHKPYVSPVGNGAQLTEEQMQEICNLWNEKE